MDNRRKHSKRVFAMLLAIIMCLSQAVTAAADEVSANETVSEESAVPEAALEETEEAAEAVPEETVSEEPEEAVSGEAVPSAAEPEEAAGDGDYPVSGNFKYEVSGNGEVIIVGLSNDNIESLVIPDYIDGKPVTVISNNAFKENFRINSVSLGSHVRTIGDYAFYNCSNLTGALTIPDSVVTIGNHAFYYCGFTDDLTIGDHVETIGDYAFACCYLFAGSLTIPDSVKTIGESAFNGCGFTGGNLTIGTNVETIGNSAFNGCRCFIGSLTIPNSVETIGESAFKDCTGFNGSLTIPDSMVTIGESAFENCTGFNGNLTIGNSVKAIGSDAFLDTGFTTISNNSSQSIPINDFLNDDTVCFVNDSGTEFREGSNISTGNYVRKIKAPTGVSLDRTEMTVSVGTRQKLTATISPDNVYDKSITWSSSDERVARVDNEGNVRGIKNGTATITATPKHGSKTAACKVTVKTGVYDDKLFYVLSDNEAEVIITGHKGGSEASGSLVIPASINVEDHNYPVTTIGTTAFENCWNLSGSLTIPDSVTTIGTAAFENCWNLSGSLTIPDSVKSIGGGAFYQCSGFTGSLTIPDSVTAIGSAAFDKCYDICRIENKSSQKLPVNWFWDVNDAKTKCFKDANGNKITNRESGVFSKGVYERKIDTSPTGVVLDQTTLEVIIGTPGTLKATVSPSNTYWDEVSWNSSDKTVATVSNGVVTGLKPGNTVITVTTVSGPFSASCNVTVKRIPVTGVTLDKSALSMYPAETEDLTATVAPSDATNKSVSWFSSDEKVATVDNGKVTSVSPGSAVITVSTNDGNFSASCNVTVYAKTTTHKVIFKDGENVLDTRFVEDGKPVAEPDSPSKNGFIFIGWSDGTSIWNFTTPVNKDLTLIAKYKAEQAVVSENTGSGMDPTPVVDEPEKKGEKTAYNLYLVKGQTFTAGGKDWTTSDTTIVSVAKNTGKITAKSKGTATVTNETTEYTVYVAAPSVSKNSKTVTVLVGQSAEISIDLQAVEGKESKYPITWYSANPKVAAVNGGMVTGIAKGSAKVTAYIGGKAYSATVKVIDTCKAPSKIKENKAEFSMNPLQSFNVKFDSSVFTVKNATWSGNGLKEVKNGYENNVISITKSGKFTAIGPGTTTVTGTDKNSKTVTVTVTVVPISTKGMAYITKDKTDTIKFPKVTNSKADSWKSSNENAVKFATTKKDGKVKGVGCGMSNISCVYKGFTFTTPVYVEDPVMVFDGKEVKNKEKLEMKVGEMKQLKINKTFQTLNFKSSKQANAFVDENGFVYARKKGKANISTKINGTTYQIAIEVKE